MSNPITDFANQAQGVQASIASTIGALTSNSNEQTDLGNQNVQLNLDLGKQSQIVQDAANQSKLAADNDKSAFALAIHADIGDASGWQKQQADLFNQATQDQADALQAVNAKKQISPFSDPIGWITAQFTVNDDINKYNAATAVKNQTESNIEAINKMASQRAATDAALQITTNAAVLKAASQETADKAQLAANQARAAALTANANSLEHITSLSVQGLTVNSQVLAARNQQEMIAMDRERLSMQEAAEKERMQNLSDKNAGYQQIADDIANGSKTMFPSNTQRQIQIASPAVIAQIRGGMPMDPETKQAYEIGVMNRLAGTTDQTRLLAHNPFEMLQVLQYKPEMSPAQRQTAQLLIDAQSEIVGGKAPAPITAAYQTAVASKDKGAIENVFNSYAQAKLDADSRRVDGPTNLFYLPSVDKIAAQIPTLQQLPFYQKVIVPALAAKVDMSDPQTVVRLGAQAVADGTMKLNDAAAGIRTIYGNGAAYGATAKSLTAMGFNPPHSYNVRIQDGGSFGSSIVNLTDPTSVTEALMKQASGKAAREALDYSQINNPGGM